MAGADKESFAGDKSGAAVSKIPRMLKEHGILWPEQEAEEARRQSLGKTALANTLRPKPFAHLSISIPDDHRAFFFFFFFTSHWIIYGNYCCYWPALLGACGSR